MKANNNKTQITLGGKNMKASNNKTQITLGGNNMNTSNNKTQITLGGNNMNTSTLRVVNNSSKHSTSYNVFNKGNVSQKKKTIQAPAGTFRARVDVRDCYSELKAAINTRHQLDLEKEKKWALVKRGISQASELQSISKRIGEQTYKIDTIIHRLLKDKRNISANKLAIDFLVGERKRTDKICRKWQHDVEMVAQGKSFFRDGSGRKVTNVSSAKDYIRKKQHRLVEIDKLLKELRK